jgi:hypothetical protein
MDSALYAGDGPASLPALGARAAALDEMTFKVYFRWR